MFYNQNTEVCLQIHFQKDSSFTAINLKKLQNHTFCGQTITFNHRKKKCLHVPAIPWKKQKKELKQENLNVLQDWITKNLKVAPKRESSQITKQNLTQKYFWMNPLEWGV